MCAYAVLLVVITLEVVSGEKVEKWRWPTVFALGCLTRAPHGPADTAHPRFVCLTGVS